MKINKKNIFIIIFSLFLFISCSEKQLEKIEDSRFAFGTYIKIMIYENDTSKAKRAIDKAFDEMQRIDEKYNSKNPKSDIYALNNGIKNSIILDDEGKYLFEELSKIYELSGHKYDITIAPLMDLWGFVDEKIDLPNLKVPTQKEIDYVKRNIDYSLVKIEGDKLYYEKPVKEIDTGSFIKGYAIERAKKVIEDEGIKHALITAISSIDSIGTKPNGNAWVIGVEDPDDNSKIFGTIKLDGKSMGVSGDYQTYVEIDGEKYHHILDLETGFPIKDKKMVVVICDGAFKADMYSTCFFLMDIDKVLEYVEKNNDLEVLIVDGKNNIHKSSGFKIDDPKQNK